MSFSDNIRRATAHGVRAFAAVTTMLTEEARIRHSCYPIATAALGRLMTGALLLAANLKTQESLTLRIAGNGPIGSVNADARSDGTVRGFVSNPQVDLPLKNGKLNVGDAVGEGHLYLTRFTGLKQPFTGSSSLVSGEIAEDIAHYLYVSEQTPSTLALGVLVRPDLSVASAGGILIQSLPDADEQILAEIEANLSIMPPLSQFIAEGHDTDDILRLIFLGMPISMYEPKPLTFACGCKRDKVVNALISLGYDELASIAADGHAELTCHYCNEVYQFNQTELETILHGLSTQ